MFLNFFSKFQSDPIFFPKKAVSVQIKFYLSPSLEKHLDPSDPDGPDSEIPFKTINLIGFNAPVPIKYI